MSYRALPFGLALPTALLDSEKVKVLEVSRNKDGGFSQVTRAMSLSGVHTKAVHGVSFSADSSRVVTSSIDGSW